MHQRFRYRDPSDRGHRGAAGGGAPAMPAMRKDSRIIHSLDKGLFLLEIVEEAERPLSLHDLWLKLKWDKATVHRLLVTLERRGYLLRDSVTRLYASLTRNFDLQTVTRPHLEKVARETTETTHLAIPVGSDIVFIDRVGSREPLSVTTLIGAREPMYCTALGKAILAFVESAELKELVRPPLKRFTRKTATSLAELRRILKPVAAAGYAVDDGEYADGIRCIAAPILNDQGYPIAALGISGPAFRLPPEKVKRFGALVRDTGLAISRRAGYDPGPRVRGKAAKPSKAGAR
jgi:DNA-binding IclR family transcriptional regulator